MVNSKKCSKCKTEKELILFSKNKQSADGLQSVCKECANKAALDYYSNNKERILAREKARGNEKLDYNKNYKEMKKAEIDAYNADYREKNRLILAEKRRQYYEKNSDKCRELTRRWGKKNLAAYRNYHHNRRVRLIGAGGTLSKGLSENLLVLQKGKCGCCKSKLDEFHMDHIIPLSKGGKNSDENIQLLCPKCNLKKGAKHPVDFMRQQGFLL